MLHLLWRIGQEAAAAASVWLRPMEILPELAGEREEEEEERKGENGLLNVISMTLKVKQWESNKSTTKKDLKDTAAECGARLTGASCPGNL